MLSCVRRSLFGIFALLCQVPVATTCAQDPNALRKDHQLAWEIVSNTLNDHCVYCHEAAAGEAAAGAVDFASELAKMEDLLAAPHLLHRTLEVVSRGEMPPESEGNLPDEVREPFHQALRVLLQTSVAQHPLPQTQIRRMNRFQYNNAVRDLFELKCEVYSLPERMMREHRGYFKPATGRMEDTVYVGSRPLGKSQMIEPRLGGVAPFPQDLRAEHGYDNQADHLSMSPLLMESFLKLGKSIVESPTFDASQVGIWPEFFAPPRLAEDQTIESELSGRIEAFLRRAFRRPVSDATLDRYLSYANARIQDGDDFTEVMKTVASAVISSPKFLYIYAQLPPGLAANAKEGAASTFRVPLDEFELATRLAFFLWASAPDQRLLELAEKGQLSDETILLEEVRRMLHDRKLKGFCDSFPSQWLQLERIISSTPDRQRYGDFYFSKYRNSMHMMMEPLLLFETVLIENRPLTDLIDPDFTYRSHHLRKAYGEDLTESTGKPNGTRKRRAGEVTVLTFDRFPVEDRRYGGVITNAAVMTMTSGPQRTQPITRGAWLATVIFNDPPQPPPADVPPLEEKEEGAEDLTLRQRLSLHRERADCRGCHEKLDPLGFALENYDVVGRWRERYENGSAVDASGALFRRHSFVDAVEFKDAILAEKDRFATGFIEHLLTFALARQLEPADASAVESIAQVVADNDYRFHTVIQQVVLSEPFRTKVQPSSLPSLATEQDTRHPSSATR